jgi:hypothetical protein
LHAKSFGGTSNATQNAIDATSDFPANSFDETANATQNATDAASDLVAIHLMEVLIQLEMQLMYLLM